jgi:UDP-galactopyranose mutase
MTRVFDWLVVGAGITGAVIASLIARKLEQRVIVIDRRLHTGGNAYDYYDGAGVMVHKYGPHIFHTNSERIVEFLSEFTGWKPYEHRVVGLVDGQFVPIPFNLTSMELVFGQNEGARLNKLLTDEFGTEVKVPILKMRESALSEVRKVADFIYEKVFLHYTIKQWDLRPEELDASVSARVPVFLSRDARYFQDTFQMMPTLGYTAMIARMLSHPNIEVCTDLEYPAATATIKFNKLVFTGPIDEFFDAALGELPYRSLSFDLQTTQSPNLILRAASENYPTPASKHPYTRITEYRCITGQQDIAATTCAYEYPEAYKARENEPYYPIPRKENRILYRKYAEMAKKAKSVVFVGRLADYMYYNMDQAVSRAIACFEEQIASRGRAERS